MGVQAGERGHDFMTTGCWGRGGEPGTRPGWPLVVARPGIRSGWERQQPSPGLTVLGHPWLLLWGPWLSLGLPGRWGGALCSTENPPGAFKSHPICSQQPQELRTLILVVRMRKLRFRESKEQMCLEPDSWSEWWNSLETWVGAFPPQPMTTQKGRGVAPVKALTCRHL